MCSLLECIKYYKDLILVCCALTTTIVAIVGVWTWKRQVIGTSKYQLARDYSRKLLLLQRYFKVARDRTFWEYEYPKGSEFATKPEINNSILKKRFDTLNGVFVELEYLGSEYSILTGNVNQDILNDLRIKRNEYREAINDYVDALEGIPNRGDLHYRVFSSDKDEFGEEIDKEVRKNFRQMSKHINYFSYWRNRILNK